MLGGIRAADAADHYGLVTFGGLPVPGADVSATRGDQRVQTTSDEEGVYRLSDLAEGVWTIQVSLLGFSVETRDVTVASDAPATRWVLTLEAFEDIARDLTPQSPTLATQAAPRVASPPAPSEQVGVSSAFQRAQVNEVAAPTVAANEEGAPPEQADASAFGAMGAVDGLLVNGSVNNGAASPFSQIPAFGNNRRRRGALYNATLGVLGGNSAWDARPFSFSDQPTPKPEYSDVHMIATFGGRSASLGWCATSRRSLWAISAPPTTTRPRSRR